VLVALALPLSVVKNGIRITTLTLLSLYVDPGFLYGKLHRDGGFVFFLLALALLYPVFLVLEKSEHQVVRRRPAGS
jgi:exosortase/archaeosortase family protein